MDKDLTLSIEGTKSTPHLEYYPKDEELLIEGYSYPENALKFYQPLFDFMEKFLEGPTTNLKVTIKLIYFNSFTSKVLLNVFDLLEEAERHHVKVSVDWFYDKENKYIYEEAIDFEQDYSSLKFNLLVQDNKKRGFFSKAM